MELPPSRPIKRLLIANRGEIATRIISTARELSLLTYALYTPNDSSHTANATHTIPLPSPSSFTDIPLLISIAKKHDIDAVHPGYGFLSESAEFAQRMWEEAGVSVVGPGWGILERTGDKLKAKELAEKCSVPTLPALPTPTSSPTTIAHFASHHGFPLMIKAVDGGGGRGIRLVRSAADLPSAVERAVAESPSRQVFAEKAAVDGFRHIEVQIVGDGTGNVVHLWERECSVQMRYQKVVEVAPSVGVDRGVVARVISDAVRMAREIKYFSLGTFEFLVHPTHRTHYFLEVNPRLQVEHTITECLNSTDLVQIQLLIAQGATLETCGLPAALVPPSPSPSLTTNPPPTIPIHPDPHHPPALHTLQLRLTASSPGKLTAFHFPTGHGLRIDTHLHPSHPTLLSTSFDPLLAKIIVSASTWAAAVRKAARALEDTYVKGVGTNTEVLRGIVASAEFGAGRCDTGWLEGNIDEVVRLGRKVGARVTERESASAVVGVGVEIPALAGAAGAGMLVRPGDAWTVTLKPEGGDGEGSGAAKGQEHRVTLARIQRQNLPESLTGTVLLSSPYDASGSEPTPYTLTLAHASDTAVASNSSAHRMASPNDPSHIPLPLSGRIIELELEVGDAVREGDVICVVQQMKMEVEVRSPKSGIVEWVCEAEEGEEVGAGTLVAVVGAAKEGKL